MRVLDCFESPTSPKRTPLWVRTGVTGSVATHCGMVIVEDRRGQFVVIDPTRTDKRRFKGIMNMPHIDPLVPLGVVDRTFGHMRTATNVSGDLKTFNSVSKAKEAIDYHVTGKRPRKRFLGIF